MGRARAWAGGAVLAVVALALAALVDQSAARLYLAEGRARAVDIAASLAKDLSAGPTAPHLKYRNAHKGNRDAMLQEAADKGLKPWVSMGRALDIDGATHMGDVYNSKGCVRSVNDPAPTMTASMDNGNFRFVDCHRVTHAGLASRIAKADGVDTPLILNGEGEKAPGSRRITSQQTGTLQSFPSDYPWQGSDSVRFQQAGNAVPPLMAVALLDTVTA